ncbi:MAG: hypothetical protein ACYC4L_16955 [Chloroflexota bacterium]
MKRSWLAGLAALALVAAIGMVFWREAHPGWQAWPTLYNARQGPEAVPLVVQALVPTQTGRPELCPTCHVGIGDISPSHPAEAFGCVVCHGGEPLALDADRAHSTMRGGRNPSDLSVAETSCGTEDCHGGYADGERNHVDRVQNSLQATYAGAIAVLRYTFGAQDSPTAQYALQARTDASRPLPAKALPSLAALPSPVVNATLDGRVQQNCLEGGCHLWSQPAAQPYYYRASGCAACHYLYDDDGQYRGADPTTPVEEPGHGAEHRLTTAVPFTQCNHCHNRGNYSLKQMAFLPREDLPAAPAAPAAEADEARRLAEYYQPMGEFTRCEYELDCVDCHTGGEVMGDGHLYGGKQERNYVQCQTCHGTPTAPPRLATIRESDELARRRARLAGREDFLAVGDSVVETESGELLWSVKRGANGELQQIAKVTGQVYTVPLVAGSKCEQDGTTQTSDHCHQCHSVSR